MSETLDQILKDVLEEEVYQYIKDEYIEVRHLSLFELGIDSLNYMMLLATLEEKLNLTIEDLNEIDTIYNIERIIANEC